MIILRWQRSLLPSAGTENKPNKEEKKREKGKEKEQAAVPVIVSDVDGQHGIVERGKTPEKMILRKRRLLQTGQRRILRIRVMRKMLQ